MWIVAGGSEEANAKTAGCNEKWNGKKGASKQQAARNGEQQR